jgi:hypothetical protein
MRRGTDAGSLSGWAAFVGPLALYVATLSPGVAFWDTGEMETVPYLLGIPHPTGFPLFVLGGWLFSHVFAIGAPAWRLSLFSALATAGSAWLLWSLVRSVTGSALTGLAAAFAFAVGDTVWTRAVRAEVHDLALFCSALALVAADRAGRTGSARMLLLAALACGLGLATHPITAFAVPCVLILAWPALRKASIAERFRALGAALAPLLLYGYFLLRSGYIAAHRLDPNDDLGLSGSALFDDGSPSSWPSFWRYVTGAAFHPSASLPRIVSGAGLSRALDLWHDVALREFSFDMLALAAIGLVYLLLRDRRLAAGLALVLVASVAFAANYRVETDSDRYALPGLWTLVACAAFGAHWVVSGLVGGPSRWTGPLAAGILFVALWPNALGAFDDVRRTNTYNDASAIGSSIAAHSPDGTLFIATWNYATPLAYADYIEHSFGSRRLITGWPPDYAVYFPLWRERFKHVYFVVSSKYDVHRLGRTVFRQGRWQFGEVR